MSMQGNRNQNAAFQAKMEELYPQKGKRERNYLRSLVIIFMIVAVAATVSDLRRPSADKAQTAFTDLVYQQMDVQKADFWLGEITAQELLSQDGWITQTDADPDIRRAAAALLDQPHTAFNNASVINWDMLKIEEAARLWDSWQSQPEGQSELEFINSQLAIHEQNKTLPGLGENVWVLDNQYLVAVHGDMMGICPLQDLKHLN